jgi:diacylglycerol kinase
MTDRDRPTRRTWREKFRDAFRGLWIGVRGQSSFAVHLPAAVLVIAAGFVLRVSHAEWCLLVLCITLVLAAEMFNSSLESMAKAIDVEHNLHLADGLDIGSAAVLVAAAGSAVIAAIVFVPRVLAFF